MIHIISYPRSGNTLFRGFVEFLSGQPTNGLIDKPDKRDKLQKPLLVNKGAFIACKNHGWDASKINTGDVVFLLVRDFKECIIRHNKATRKIDYESFKGYITDYINLLVSYDLYTGHKALFYYEDFLHWGTETLRKKLLSIYPNPQSQGKEHYHIYDIGMEEAGLWNDYVMRMYPEITEKYLNRYIK